MNLPHCWRRLSGLALLVCCLSAAALQAADPVKVDPLDWPHWRGPEMNGISREKDLPESWSPDGENLVWKNEALATRSTPVVLRGKLYTICRSFPESTREGEKIVCADANTGKILWESIHNIYLSDAPAERVGWSAVAGDPATGYIYAHGLAGMLKCLDGETGKVLWQHSLSEEYGILSTYGGRTNFPTLFEDLVIISGVMTGWGEYAIPAHRFVAFDKLTGQAVWITSTRVRPPDTTYSTPILATFKGQAALVVGASDGAVHALQPRTGKPIWKYDASIRGLNQTPVISGSKVWCGHSEEDADDPKITGSFFCIDGTGKGDISKQKPLWSVKEIASGRSAPLLLKDRLYVTTDAATMFILNANSGAEVGKQKLGTIMMGSAVYGDGKIYCGEATGRWYILKPTPQGVKVLHKLRLNEEELLASPVISHGKVYISSNGAMYCIGKPRQKPAADSLVPREPELPVEVDTQPAHLQIVPVEALLHSGEKQRFHVRAYNVHGRYLKTVPATFAVKGSGQVDSSGTFIPAHSSQPAAVMVTATFGKLASTARVRVFPPLPWKFDFSDKHVPAPWIGMQYRHQPRVVENNPVIVKITTIPLGTRSQGWMGPPDLHDCTIQADVQCNSAAGKFADMGLINQRYTLDMMGTEQQLQIRSWTSRRELRFAKNEPFVWKQNVWYTLKFRAENKDGQAVLKGKAWVRGQPEPAKWTIEAADATPNVQGSPGLFGRSNEAEIFIDNVQVYPNQE